MTTVISNSNSTQTTNNPAATLDGQRDTNALQTRRHRHRRRTSQGTRASRRASSGPPPGATATP
ncbi:MAG: hypothetical protein F4X66_13055 [Chloroflexi bacterium]|nr:hypothetical protein [Chloroflexota bacterium]